MRTESDNAGPSTEYVTAMIGGQLFGLPIARVQDVFVPDRMTQVPLSSPDIAGILNLRGRIVTVIDMRCRLGVPQQKREQPPRAVGIECRGESYGLLIDDIGEVMTLPDSMRENNPVNLDARLAQVSSGVIRLDSQLMVVLDIDRVLQVSAQIKAA
ncbi:MAG TPA: chemotaxis protein CheW [Xanthobacteraceae bacterium]|nr:chemotaxis protein CheW [Xanthobacteraceae bacterium]